MKQNENSLLTSTELLRLQRDLGVALNDTLSLPEVLRLLLDSFFKSLEIDAASILIFGDSLTEIVLESSKGFSKSMTDKLRKTIIQSSNILAAANGISSFSPVSDLESYLDTDDSNPFLSLGIIPLVYIGKPLGSVIIASRSREKMSLECRFTLENIATRVAGIINRINGEETLKRINHTLEDLNTRLKFSEERYRAVVEDQTDLICRFKPEGIISFVNSAYCRYFCLPREKLIGHSFLPNIHPDDKDRTQIHLRALGPDRPVATIEHRIILPDGSTRWIEWTDRAIVAMDNIIIEYQSVGRDVTERKCLEERLQFMSMHDALTRLYNRAYFDEQMKRLADGRYLPVGIIVSDLNALKIVNDALGHQIGDTLLLTASSVLRSCFRGSDIVARIGGDEFAVLLPNTNEESLLQTINRIKKSIHMHREGNPDIPLSLAIGYSVRTKKSTTMEEIFSEADDMMYREKENQRDFTRGLVLTSLIRAIERLEPYRAGHMLRVRDFSLSLGAEAKLTDPEIARLQLASRYHDIGMIGIDKEFLEISGRLCSEEEEAVRRHVDIGARIAEAHPFLREIAQIIQHHHEKWDGSGYPSGLSGEDIPRFSRIISICDAYDAMTSHPLYHPLLQRDEALDEITRLSGISFDPDLALLFVRLMKRGPVGV
ncbi:MAG TPA: diguanylate cyclase [Spirochaetota bacterium]